MSLKDLQGGVFEGLTEVAFLVASSSCSSDKVDGDLVVRQVMEWAGCEVQEQEVSLLVQACSQAIEREGYDARVNAILRNLPTKQLRIFALNLGAAVFHANEEFRMDQEGELFLALGISMGIPCMEILECIQGYGLDLLDRIG